MPRLASAAVADGTPTADERADLATVARLLELTKADLDTALAAAADQGAQTATLLARGDGLPAGTTVAFVGNTIVPRNELVARATAAGLAVVPAAEPGVNLVVAEDPEFVSTAHRTGSTRIVVEPVFLALLARTTAGRAEANGDPDRGGPAAEIATLRAAEPANQRPAAAPPGWYPDPTRPAQQRYWDGTAWTEHTHQAAQATPASWYPDPHGVTRLRYWDGAAWTQHVGD